ncbi:MAG: DUF2064 domain-containing protein [Candidatus Hydrogenedentota bacterium]|nr:MAG: DUF2064 domain-containing protein [Candidatus Hydrogenedentota bacterium]
MEPRILVFTRYPVPGKAKTRLMDAIGPEEAAAVQRKMTEALVARLRGLEGVRIEVWYTGAEEGPFRCWLGDGLDYHRQGGGSLGRRLFQAFRAGVPALAVGADVPGLSRHHIERALEDLKSGRNVIGPAEDGGYYLLGLSSVKKDFFEEIAWGTETVFPETKRRLEESGVPLTVLPELSDLDRPEDLTLLHRVSVVIPVSPKESEWEERLEELGEERDAEVLLVSGRYRRPPDRIREKYPRVIWLFEAGSRAARMNRGAAYATGEYLCFLHSDTRLPEKFQERIRRVLTEHPDALGAFRLGIDSRERKFRITEYGVDLRSRLLRLPYGDQAFFLTRPRFFELGGFRDLPFMEDFDFVVRARKRGPVILDSARVMTSARRWKRLGWSRTFLVNQIVVARYLFGGDIARLQRYYCDGGSCGAGAEGLSVVPNEDFSIGRRPTPAEPSRRAARLAD